MSNGTMVSKVTSVLLSVLLSLNCFSATGLAGAIGALSSEQDKETTAYIQEDVPSVDGEKTEKDAATASDYHEPVAVSLSENQDKPASVENGPAVDGGTAQTSSDQTVVANLPSTVATERRDAFDTQATRAGTSTDLGLFLTDVIIDAPMDENGAYIINPNSSYEMTMYFAENENLQFEDGETLVYDLPEGVVLSDIGPTLFTINVTDENGSAVVYDNSFEVVDGQLRVNFNQNDPNYGRLTAMPNVSFDLTVSSRLDQSAGEIIFNAVVVKDFVFEEKSDLTIYKSVVYDMDSDTAHYELQVRSVGVNENVVIEDTLTGSALIFNQDVEVESVSGGTLPVVPDYETVPNGFRVVIPQTADGEILILRYSASVDNTKISSNGTVEQTNNTARVFSDQVPDGKEVSADFAGQAKFQKIQKIAAGEPVQVGDKLYRQAWTIIVNADHKLPMGNTYIHDWIVQNSRPFMQFDGEGIAITVTFEDGERETRAIPWGELYLYQNSGGTYGWRYLTPGSDGKASYEITFSTLIDSSAALGDLTLANGAQVYGSYDEATTSVGVIGEDTLSIEKEAIGTTSTESDWEITVTVPGAGLPEMHIVDDGPQLVYEGQTYIDYPQADSFEVEGLLEGESWRLRLGETGRSFTITFYRNETPSEANKGLLPTPDGQARDIVIRFKTTVNQDWLNLAAEDGYASSNLYRHRNYACAWSNNYRTDTVNATVIPIKPNMLKSFVERTDVEIDGVSYPVFRYSLALLGPTADGIIIRDSFDTEHLKLHSSEGVQVLGGMTTTPTDGNGTVSATDTQDGIDITVSSFPKRSDGSFYPYYEVHYSLIVKDLAALEALNEAAAASQGGVDLENTASWDNLVSSRTVNYSFFPYVDKELVSRPTSDNGFVAEFKVIINKYADDLDPTSDVLAIQDVLSPNLRFIPDSLSIEPSSDSIVVQFDDETNTLTLIDVPDETAFEITYQARVLGSGNVAYSNTVKFGNFEKTIEETSTIEYSGGGTASNPSITLVKRDAENISKTLAGATFELYYLADDGPVPVRDSEGRTVTLTTGDNGEVLIVGHIQNLGWALWAGRTYCLVETVAPTGYEVNTEPTYFILTNTPSSQIEYTITGDRLTINNAPTRIDIPVTKAWLGPIGAESVRVHLLANDVDTGQTITLTADGNWEGSFDNVRKFDDTGSEIIYSIVEDPVNDYAPRYTGSAEEGFTITNINTETIEIPVTKTWIGPPADSATILLIADDVVVSEAELTAETDWQHTFSRLPKYDDEDGHEIAYDVRETSMDGYTWTCSGSAETGFVITNTNIEMTTVSGTKTWDDAGNQDGVRPDIITIHLLADGVEIDTMDVTEDDGWTWSFEGLSKYDADDGHEIMYAITEDAVEGYSTAYDGFNVTNTHTPGKTSVTVVKSWNDVGNKDGIRPKSVTIRLLADGAETGITLELNEAGNWTGSFTDLDEFKNGMRIVYSVAENAVPGYTTSISGDMSKGYTVTNNHEVTDTPPKSKGTAPKTGDETYNASVTAIEMAMLGVALAGLASFLRYRRKHSN